MLLCFRFWRASWILLRQIRRLLLLHQNVCNISVDVDGFFLWAFPASIFILCLHFLSTDVIIFFFNVFPTFVVCAFSRQMSLLSFFEYSLMCISVRYIIMNICEYTDRSFFHVTINTFMMFWIISHWSQSIFSLAF